MTPIDLIEFAQHSRKLPKTLLAPLQYKESLEVWKILSAHFFDFSLVFMTSTLMASIFNLSVKSFLVTRGLRVLFSEGMTFKLAMAFLPVVLFTYFFCCYFLNHGQTLGMLILKRRMKMKSNSIQDAFSWATHSFLLCTTGGISLRLKKSVWTHFMAHDHLYSEMLVHKEVAVIDLVADAEKNEEVHHYEEYSRAA